MHTAHQNNSKMTTGSSAIEKALRISLILLCLCTGFSLCMVKARGVAHIRFADTVALKKTGLDTITSRLLNLHLAEKHTPKEIKDILEKMRPDGSFDDINYADTSLAIWRPLQHLERLAAMMVAYRTLKSPYHHDQHLLNSVLSSLDFYRLRKPASANWWYRDIGSPQVMMIILLLLKGEIDQPLLMSYSADLKDATGKPSFTGKNLTWVSEITIYKGCIENNYQLIEKGFNAIASTLVIAGKNKEGIQADHSFHQHHAQLYEGGYGLSIIGDFAKYIQLSQRTIFAKAFTAEKKQILTDVLLHGHQLLGYRKAIDFGSVGRNITRKNGTENISPSLLGQLSEVDPTYATEYQNWQKHVDGGSFPAPGNTYFWDSDIMVQHGSNYYLSAKVISDRTYGTESLNGENIKGYNLPLGATNIMVSGSEYFNIFPVWDWSRIPGTTALFNEQATSLKNYQIGTNRFAGGVSDGRSGAIAYEHSYHGVTAKKAYFFVDGRMVCLGAGISCKENEQVITSVDQCFANGVVTLGMAAGKNDLKDVQKTFTGLKWLYHNNIGYIFPQGGKVTVKKAVQTGSWSAINTSGDDTPIHAPVFSAWIDHGISPVNSSYYYIVAPDIKLTDIEDTFKKQAVEVLQNDTLIQAIRVKDHVWCVFYRGGKLACAGGPTITSEAPALIMIDTSDGKFNITASDPLHQQQNITLLFDRKLTGPGAITEHGITKIMIPTPQGTMAGKPVTVAYKSDGLNN